jgi:hypothetical protein
MSMNAAELCEAGLALPPAVRKAVALRLLDSLKVADKESIDAAWTAEISAQVDGVLAGAVATVPGERVFAELAARRGAPPS